jgi:hypothetical protein
VFGVRPRAQTGTETQGQEPSAHVRGWSCTLDAVAALGAVDCHAALCGTHRASRADRCLARRMARVQRCSLAVMQPHLAGLLVSCPGLSAHPSRIERSRSKELNSTQAWPPYGRKAGKEVLRQPARPPQYLLFQLLVPDTQPLSLALPCLPRRCAVRHHREIIPRALACFLRKRAATSLNPPIPPSATTHNHSTIPRSAAIAARLARGDEHSTTDLPPFPTPSLLPRCLALPHLDPAKSEAAAPALSHAHTHAHAHARSLRPPWLPR